MVENKTFPTPEQLPDRRDLDTQRELAHFIRALEWHEAVRLSPQRLLEVIEKTVKSRLRRRLLDRKGTLEITFAEISNLLGFTIDSQNPLKYEPMGLTERQVEQFIRENQDNMEQLLRQHGLTVIGMHKDYAIEVTSPEIAAVRESLKAEAVAAVGAELLRQPRAEDITFRMTDEQTSLAPFQVAAVQEAAAQTGRWKHVRFDTIIDGGPYGLSLYEVTFFGVRE